MSSRKPRGRRRGGRRPARERSAGGVVVRDGQIVVIVPTRRASDGSRVLALPKGHIDPGETALQAATREVREETGVVGEPVQELGEARYWYRRDGQTIPKSVTFFLFSYVDGDTADHDDEVTWSKSAKTDSLPSVQVLNFYSTIFADELKRGRKTATIRLGDKSSKYRKNQAVLVTIGYQYSPRERIFEAVIDQVEVMKLADLSPRDIKHDNPEFRRHEELISFLEQIYGRSVSPEDVVTVVRFSQIRDNPTGMTEAMKGYGGAQN
jgi:8-oxo-dGTP pyrophosphatase MutT (NUDIX family)